MKILEKCKLFLEILSNLRAPKTYEGQVHMSESAAVRRSEKIIKWGNKAAEVQTLKIWGCHLRVSNQRNTKRMSCDKLSENWTCTNRVPPRLTLQRLMTIASFLLPVFLTWFIHPCLTFTPYPFCSESLPLFWQNTPDPKLFEQDCKTLCCGEMYLGVRQDPNKPRDFLHGFAMRTMAWSPNSSWYSALKSPMIHFQGYLFSTFMVQITNLHWSVQEAFSLPSSPHSGPA